MESRTSGLVVVAPSTLSGVVAFGLGLVAGLLLATRSQQRRETHAAGADGTTGAVHPPGRNIFSARLTDLVGAHTLAAAGNFAAANVQTGIALEVLFAWQRSINDSNDTASAKAHQQDDTEKENKILQSDIRINQAFWAKAQTLVAGDIGTVNGFVDNLKAAAKAIPNATNDINKWNNFFSALNAVVGFFKS